MWHHAFCLLAYNTHVSKPDGCDACMKTYASNYIKKTSLAVGEADILSGDILTPKPESSEYLCLRRHRIL